MTGSIEVCHAKHTPTEQKYLMVCRPIKFSNALRVVLVLCSIVVEVNCTQRNEIIGRDHVFCGQQMTAKQPIDDE